MENQLGIPVPVHLNPDLPFFHIPVHCESDELDYGGRWGRHVPPKPRRSLGEPYLNHSASGGMEPRLRALLLLALLVTRVSAGEQRFAMEPQDQTAIVGSRVTLPCRVINKTGVLQWTKDDFGLGTHRNLSGFDRYSMIGSDEEVMAILCKKRKRWCLTDLYKKRTGMDGAYDGLGHKK
uniref:Irregular chiasm C-roughest protein n=1 Tax=Timema cristinae TaxID=61476 RepID=A0A7R9GUE6_TIMCR|nr:unnamed protein product [Timema cristinae]